jgi:TRAP-type C4-dicarboxylate transport system permease small subunit
VVVSQASVPPDVGPAGRLASIHDRLSGLSFAAAMCALSVIAVSFCYEVAARYFFNAPTIWANPFASYALCASIFLAMPELTRTSSHITLSFLEDAMAPAGARRLRRALHALSAAACGLAAWITAEAAWNDYSVGIVTNTYYPIPKWWLSAVIPYGMASSAIYFLRQATTAWRHPSGMGAIS